MKQQQLLRTAKEKVTEFYSSFNHIVIEMSSDHADSTFFFFFFLQTQGAFELKIILTKAVKKHFPPNLL